MSFTEDAATLWDKPTATQVVIPQEARNFQRPQRQFQHSTVPLEDDNMAADTNTIMQFQQFLRGCPLGICYSGPIDGESSTKLLAAVYSLESTANKTFQEKINLTSAAGLSLSELNKLKSLIAKNKNNPPTETSPQTTETPQKLSNLNKFQKAFKLPISDTLDPILIQKLKAKEKEIAAYIEDSSVIGMIVKNNKINVSFQDFISALNLIKKFKAKEQNL